jgi:hypothetical protein
MTELDRIRAAIAKAQAKLTAAHCKARPGRRRERIGHASDALVEAAMWLERLR